jgi:hypothetical protein
MLVHLLNKAQLPYMSKGISTDKGNMGNRLMHLAFFASAGVVRGGAVQPALQPSCSPHRPPSSRAGTQGRQHLQQPQARSAACCQPAGCP